MRLRDHAEVDDVEAVTIDPDDGDLDNGPAALAEVGFLTPEMLAADAEAERQAWDRFFAPRPKRSAARR